ncbi:hypothetical protein EHQ12_13410 [Leptospira gomenensis]|uniref:Uncharacterized protein n=1 Tax=Leptospira gomenensis TaxID=2484974 RepID=A0A5F1Y5U7_9LEPT|nr:hypothetical protein [Leptospira gomenensis]TGK28082.1 hypothetical protein EHQ17_18555 [Leptospira gomenensis]TGK37062.1 hypothetical protein EHQ12_13410 [Leptospira gomenensis]TGK45698.1 hypothetical protein EHQ07_08420 [Leptospira gomenensis]TGK59637.1 hypothetical protein EHQ13_12630 [Leptospira gomenensis]
MEFKKKIFFVTLLLAIFLMLFLLFWPEDEKKESLSMLEESETVLKTKYYSEMDPYFPDAPHPFNEDPDLEGQAKRLWPEAFKPRKTPEEKEQIRKEWTDFIARYPKNIYIPSEFKPALSESEEKEARDRLDSVSNVETKNAINRALGKYAEPGNEPKSAPSESSVNPKEQLAYINYKIEELESRIQLIEYTIQQGKLDAAQIPTANQDLAIWKKELSQLKQVQSLIPKS